MTLAAFSADDITSHPSWYKKFLGQQLQAHQANTNSSKLTPEAGAPGDQGYTSTKFQASAHLPAYTSSISLACSASGARVGEELLPGRLKALRHFHIGNVHCRDHGHA
jgi:hypothetical protein